ncbi:DUF6893 family small protein [Streptomyces sp. NPDC058442]
MKKTLVGGAAAVTAATAVTALAVLVRGVLPDVRRYLRMRRM